MGQISVTLETWIAKRMLAYFNRARVPQDISEGILKDNPEEGSGSYVIGDVVAERIIERREGLPGKQFTSISQLNGIQGLGEDKFSDLLYTFSVPAADAFTQAMYENVIGENWVLRNHSTRFGEEDAFQVLATDPEALKAWVTARVGEIGETEFRNPKAAKKARKEMAKSCLETYESGHIAAYAFALWFYRFDADNWFTYDQVRTEAELYLDFMPMYEDRSELHFYKGFQNVGIVTEPISVKDLPVVVNHSEKTITLWTARLAD